MHDLIAEFLGFLIGTFDVVGVDGNDRVLGHAFVTRYELDAQREAWPFRRLCSVATTLPMIWQSSPKIGS